MLRVLSPSWARAQSTDTGDAPSPEELPPWRPSKVIPPLAELEVPQVPQSMSESPEAREICWTPSFKSLVAWPSHECEELVHQEVPKDQGPESPESPESPEGPEGAEGPEGPEGLGPQQSEELPGSTDAKPSRISMAPTVHDAVCEDGLDSEEEKEERYAEIEDVEQAQESQATDSTDVNEAVLREVSELRAALQKERAEKDEIAALQQQTAEKLNSCEAEMAQMEQELKKSRAERDALRRRLQETAEQHVELTKRLRSWTLNPLNEKLSNDLQWIYIYIWIFNDI